MGQIYTIVSPAVVYPKVHLSSSASQVASKHFRWALMHCITKYLTEWTNDIHTVPVWPGMGKCFLFGSNNISKMT